MMTDFDRLAERIAGEFEKVVWERLTIDQRQRARKAAHAVMTSLGIGVGELSERMRYAEKRAEEEQEVLRRIRAAKDSCTAETAGTKHMLSGKFRGMQRES